MDCNANKSPSELTPDQQTALQELAAFLQSEDEVFILKGAAGTGKTFLLQRVLQHLEAASREYFLLAPTGRATKVLRERTNRPAGTLHGKLYTNHCLQEVRESEHTGSETFILSFEQAANHDDGHAVYIVDEASMLSDEPETSEFLRWGSGRLLLDLIDYVQPRNQALHRKIIFVGDPYQLPPVKGNASPALDAAYLRKHYEVGVRERELREVMRQHGDSGILRHARTLREGLERAGFGALALGSLPPDVVESSHETLRDRMRDGEADRMVIAYSNAEVASLNRLHREQQGFPDGTPVSGERLLVVRNTKRDGIQLVNGDFVWIHRVSAPVIRRVVPLRRRVDGQSETLGVHISFRELELRTTPGTEGPECKILKCLINEELLWSPHGRPSPDHQKALYVDFKLRNPSLSPGSETFKNALMDDPFFSSVQVKFGYAVTCHKAQGGEWEEVHVDFGETVLLHEQGFRWMYTAITRARSRLFLINPPKVRLFSRTQEMRSADASSPCVPPGTLAQRIREEMEKENVQFQEIINHPFAWEAKGMDPEQGLIRLRICYNRQNRITSVQALGRTNPALLERFHRAFQGGTTAPNSPVQEETTPARLGTPSEEQERILQEIEARVDGHAVRITHTRVLTPYHLRINFRNGDLTTRLDLYNNQAGTPTRIAESPGTANDPQFTRDLMTLLRKD